MAFHKSICVLIAIFVCFVCSSHAYTFEVGGRDGWTTHPSENYNSWSSKLPFLINDTLHFEYDGKVDSVLVVNKGDYDGCNVNSPIMKLEGGDSMFNFDRSGSFYFISGNKASCEQGQKLVVVVWSLKNDSPAPSTVTPPPTGSPNLQPSPPTIFPGGGSPAFLGGGSASAPGNAPRGGGASSPGRGGSASSPENAPRGGGVSSPGRRGSASSPGNAPRGGGASSPGGRGSASFPGNAPEGGSASSPSIRGGASSSNRGGGESSRGGGGSSSSGGAGAQSPGSNNTAEDMNTPPSPSTATPSLSGSKIASLVTMIVALWWSI